jgi:hypothetical protein
MGLTTGAPSGLALGASISMRYQLDRPDKAQGAPPRLSQLSQVSRGGTRWGIGRPWAPAWARRRRPPTAAPPRTAEKIPNRMSDVNPTIGFTPDRKKRQHVTDVTAGESPSLLMTSP